MPFQLLSYQSETGPRAGIKIGERVWDAAALAQKPGYVSALDVLIDWSEAAKRYSSFAQSATPPAGGMPLARLALLAPVLYPGQIFAAGANYQDHIDEMGRGEFKAQNAKKAGGRPWFFGKTSRSAVVGTGSTRPLPHYSKKVDWEIELAVVIGQTASRVSA